MASLYDGRRRSGAVPPRLKLPYSQRGSGQAEKREQKVGMFTAKRSQTISKGHVVITFCLLRTPRLSLSATGKDSYGACGGNMNLEIKPC